MPWTYEELILTHNRDHEKIKRCNDVVEAFVAERGLVVYGGTAIDFALRQHGDKIYEDASLDFTDYDFYSSDVIRDAFDLASKIASDFNTTDVAIINAIHMRTTKVMFCSIMVADISYCAPEVFSRLQTLKYKTKRGVEVRFLAPSMQVIDIHSSLSEPFANPPNEVQGHRVERDWKRFEKLQPWLVGPAGDGPKWPEVTVVANMPAPHALLVGVGAYIALVGGAAGTVERAGDVVTMRYKGPKLPLMFFVEMALTAYEGEPYERLLDWLVHSKRSPNCWVFGADRSLYPCLKWPGGQCASAQHTLKLFLILTWFSDGDLAIFYWQCYVRLLGALGDGPTDVWPHTNAPNESMSLIYGRMLTHANISDRQKKGVTGAVDKVLALRPPNLYFNSGSFEARSKAFLAWKPSTEFYSSNGQKIKAAP